MDLNGPAGLLICNNIVIPTDSGDSESFSNKCHRRVY